jgi:hypothetical protein
LLPRRAGLAQSSATGLELSPPGGTAPEHGEAKNRREEREHWPESKIDRAEGNDTVTKTKDKLYLLRKVTNQFIPFQFV